MADPPLFKGVGAFVSHIQNLYAVGRYNRKTCYLLVLITISENIVHIKQSDSGVQPSFFKLSPLPLSRFIFFRYDNQCFYLFSLLNILNLINISPCSDEKNCK